MNRTVLRPDDPNIQGIRPPMVFVRDIPQWEYKCVSRSMDADGIPGERELNELGSEGWELVCILHHELKLNLYFKRVKNVK
ncbi:MAG: hypothetical protein PVG14_19045 [Anaerolineales bacterium]